MLYSPCAPARAPAPQMREVRSKMEEDERVSAMMRGFRGSNIDEADFADSRVKMALVEVNESRDSDEQLPLVSRARGACRAPSVVCCRNAFPIARRGI